jgi:hypothetical protein
MKTVKSILSSLILALIVSTSLIAQAAPKVVAVVTKADWCSVCKANGERAMAAFMENNKDGSVKFYMNDLTDDQTKKKSADELKPSGLYEVANKIQGTGMVSFYNPATKMLISQVSVSETDSKLAAALSAAKNSVK